MDYHRFIGQVQHRARLASFEQAVAATRATLETLGERLFGGEPHNLAAQLPGEIGRYLEQSLLQVSFGLPEFYDRVAQREGVDYPTAVFHAREVLSVLEEAVTPGALKKALDQLPSEYDQLFEAAPRSAEGQ